MRSKLILAVVAASFLPAAALAQCPYSSTQTPNGSKPCESVELTSLGQKSIVETAVGAGSFDTLVAAVKAAGLAPTLDSKGPFTVFAPTDEAFAKIPEAKLQSLLKPENRPLLKAILTYHVVPGTVTAEQVVKLDNATTVNGQRVDIDVSNNGVTVGGAKVVKTDIRCKNGIIHAIDSVILPSTDDLVDTAVAAGKFETLATALKTAQLVATLKSDGPFTVFAPTDAAFAKLPGGVVASLLEPANRKKLTEILTFHVVPGRVYADQVVTLSSADTVAGVPVSIAVRDGSVYLNGKTKVVKTDIEASNGVIHVIDSVLIPGSDM